MTDIEQETLREYGSGSNERQERQPAPAEQPSHPLTKESLALHNQHQEDDLLAETRDLARAPALWSLDVARVLAHQQQTSADRAPNQTANPQNGTPPAQTRGPQGMNQGRGPSR